jgi:hypothetical protein
MRKPDPGFDYHRYRQLLAEASDEPKRLALIDLLIEERAARPAIQTLERLHAELGGKILENRQQAENLGQQMMHVEAVIKMLDPAYNLTRITVKRRQANRWFKRDTIYRKALDVPRRLSNDRNPYRVEGL